MDNPTMIRISPKTKRLMDIGKLTLNCRTYDETINVSLRQSINKAKKKGNLFTLLGIE